MDNIDELNREKPIWLNDEQPEFDVGIVGVWLVKNYGNSLTYYALYHTICDLGFSALMIERCADAPAYPEYQKPPLFKNNPYPSGSLSSIYRDRLDMKALNKRCKMFVVGSDQLLYQKLYFLFGRHINLSWVSDEKYKIAYALSLGHDDNTSECERGDKAYYFSKFDAFSIREPSGVRIAKEKFDITAQCVLDPVFICSKKHFDSLIDDTINEYKEPYVGAYLLNPNEYKADILKQISVSYKCALHIFGDADHDVEYANDKPLEALGFHPVIGNSVEDWLKMLSGSSFYITDSYHGMCMALIYHVPFLAIKNETRGGTRFEHLIELLELQNHVIDEGTTLSKKHFEPIDFEKIERLLEKERQLGINWLKNALNNGKRSIKSKSTYDIVDQRCDDLTKYCHGLEEHCHGLQTYCDGLDLYCRDLSDRYDKLHADNLNLTAEMTQLQRQFQQLQKMFRITNELLLDKKREIENNLFIKIGHYIKKIFKSKS